MKKLLHYQFSLAGLQHDMVAIFGLWLAELHSLIKHRT